VPSILRRVSGCLTCRQAAYVDAPLSSLSISQGRLVLVHGSVVSGPCDVLTVLVVRHTCQAQPDVSLDLLVIIHGGQLLVLHDGAWSWSWDMMVVV